MKNRIVISSRQFTILVIMNIIGTTILIVPQLMVDIAGRDAWMAAVAALLFSMPLLGIYIALSRKHPDLTLTQMFEIVVGKLAGKFISVLFIMIYPFLLAALTLRNIGDFLVSQIMPETPIEAIHIIVMLVVVYAVQLGLEPIARIGEVFIPIVLFMLIIMFLAITPQIHFDQMYPLLENGIQPVFGGAFVLFSFPFMELVIVLMVSSNVNEQKKVGKSFFYGILIGWAILFITTLLTVLVLGPYVAANEIFPSYSLAKRINLADVFERVEITIAVAWFITSFFRVCFYFYCVVSGLGEAFNLEDKKLLNIPLATLLTVLSLIVSPNISFLIHMDRTALPFFNATFGILLPLLLLLFLTLKRMLGK